MLIRNLTMQDLAGELGIGRKSRRIYGIILEVEIAIDKYGGFTETLYNRRELEELRYILRRIDHEGAELQAAINEVIAMWYDIPTL